MDWRGACIAPLYNGKGNKYECGNPRMWYECGNSRMSYECGNSSVAYQLHSSAVGKLCRVWAGTDCAIGKEHSGFSQSRGWMDEVFAVRHVCEKFIVNIKYMGIYGFGKGV